MSEQEKVREWCQFYRKSALKYEMNALLAVLETDGERVLNAVLKELGLERALDLIKDARLRER